jgi:hypothetical protein
MTACVAILGWNFCRTDGARRVAPPRVRNGIIAQDFTRKGRKVLVMGGAQSVQAAHIGRMRT